MLGGANRAPRPRPAESAGGAAGAEGWDEIGECPTAPSPTKQNPKTQPEAGLLSQGTDSLPAAGRAAPGGLSDKGPVPGGHHKTV